MALKFRLTTLDGLPDNLKAEYAKQDDGSYALSVEDVVPKAKLEEFRTNNKKLFDENNELKTRYKDIDPAKVKQLEQELSEIRSGSGEKFERLLGARVNEKVEGVVKERDQYLKERDHYRGIADRHDLSQEIRRALATHKIEPSSEFALEDITHAVSTRFGVDAKTRKAVDRNTDEDPKTLGVFIKEMVQNPRYGHYFKGAQGSGASGGVNGRSGNGVLGLTRAQAARPTPEQMAEIAKGNYTIID